MKNFIIAASAALFVSGAFAGSALAENYGHNDHRNGNRHMHHSRVCKDIYKNRVVWRHGHRQVVRVKVGRHCY